MDNNKKEESEKLIKSEISLTTPTTAETTTIKTTNLSTTSDNDTASTDSGELLASWTLVNDKENKKPNDESDDHIEILKHWDTEADEEEDDSDGSCRVNLDEETDEEIYDSEEELGLHHCNKCNYSHIRGLQNCTPVNSASNIFGGVYPRKTNEFGRPMWELTPELNPCRRYRIFSFTDPFVDQPSPRPMTTESQLRREHELSSKLYPKAERPSGVFDDPDVKEKTPEPMANKKSKLRHKLRLIDGLISKFKTTLQEGRPRFNNESSPESMTTTKPQLRRGHELTSKLYPKANRPPGVFEDPDVKEQTPEPVATNNLEALSKIRRDLRLLDELISQPHTNKDCPYFECDHPDVNESSPESVATAEPQLRCGHELTSKLYPKADRPPGVFDDPDVKEKTPEPMANKKSDIWLRPSPFSKFRPRFVIDDPDVNESSPMSVTTTEPQLRRGHELTSKLYPKADRPPSVFDDDDVKEKHDVKEKTPEPMANKKSPSPFSKLRPRFVIKPLPQTLTTESQIRRRPELTPKLHFWEDHPLHPEETSNHSYVVLLGIALLLLLFSEGLLCYVVNTTYRKFPTAIDHLREQVNEMELQNNLMRAEIDLLNKQVKYLSTLNDPQQQKSGKYKDNKGDKVFKAWSGNGDSLKPVDITKQDLKNPYKCPDGSFVEIANMCMEQRSDNDPSIMDQLGQVVENLKDQSETFATFEEVAEELHGFQDNHSEGSSTLYASHTHHKDEYKNSNDYKKPSGKDNSHESKKSKFGRRGSSEVHDNDSDNAEWQEKRMKGREQLRNKNKSDEDDDDDDDSGEWHEKYMKHREQQRKKNEYKSGSHEWHDNYMKNREQQRKQAEQKTQYKKNGHSRENKQRSGEKLYR